MAKDSECNQAKACQRGSQGRKGKMRRKVQANGDEGKAGGPKHHDHQKAEGSANGHCRCAKLCPMQRTGGFIGA
jgi:hypothetical protein